MLASLVLFLCPFQTQPVIELPAGGPIRFDGKIEQAEWDPAFSVTRPLSPKHKVRLMMRRNGPWLVLGLSADRPYQGELVRLVVADDAGSWVCTLFLSLAHPHMPPGIWRRGSPGNMARVNVRPECPRAVRARVHAGSMEGWSAEYMVRLSALGSARATRGASARSSCSTGPASRRSST